MISIDTVYQKVLALANKEQRGYITPQDFNLFADQAQKEIFEQYFYDLNQFRRLNSIIKTRVKNRNKIIEKLITSPLWNKQFSFLEIAKNVKPSFFGLPILISKKYLSKKKQFFNFLKKKGIETRIVISGNFVNQPSVKIYNLNPKNESFPKAQEIENRGFFIGLHPKSISEETLNHLERNLLKISEL